MLQPSPLSPSFTHYLAAMAGLHSNAPTKPTSLHTCAASALLNDAHPRAAAAQINAVLVRVCAAVGGGYCKEIVLKVGDEKLAIRVYSGVTG